MKKRTSNSLLAMVTTIFTTSFALAQAPQAIPFQAAARNSSGVILANKTVALRFSILDGQYNSMTLDTVAYQETQNVITNALGLFMVNIGQGNPVKGTLNGVNWEVNAKFIRVELDTSGSGTNYITIGTQQMMSVPFALNAGNGVPPGTIEAYGGYFAPAGWMVCQGGTLSRTANAALFAVIGTSYGNGDGNTTFNVPDFRGKFLRGWDNNAGVDPEASSRVQSWTGSASGNQIGSYQDDAFKAHNHFEFTNGVYSTFNTTIDQNTTSPAYAFYDGGSAYGKNSYVINFDAVSGTKANLFPGGITGGTESRPKNVYVNYIIKL